MFKNPILMQAAGEGGGAGGGAPAGGDGGGAGGESPKYVTIEQLNDTLNKALGARDKRFEQSFSKSLDERLAKLQEAFAPKPPPDDPGGAGDGGKGKAVDPEFVKMKQQLEAQGKALEAERKAREAAETKSRTEKARAQLQGALSKHVRPDALGLVLKALAGDVQFDENGEPVFPLPDGTGTSTIDAAIDAWAKSDGAKAFIPAPNSGGAGTQQRPMGGARLTRDPATVPPQQWTAAERAEMLRRNQEMLADRARKNPMGFG